MILQGAYSLSSLVTFVVLYVRWTRNYKRTRRLWLVGIVAAGIGLVVPIAFLGPLLNVTERAKWMTD